MVPILIVPWASMRNKACTCHRSWQAGPHWGGRSQEWTPSSFSPSDWRCSGGSSCQNIWRIGTLWTPGETLAQPSFDQWLSLAGLVYPYLTINIWNNYSNQNHGAVVCWLLRYSSNSLFVYCYCLFVWNVFRLSGGGAGVRGWELFVSQSIVRLLRTVMVRAAYDSCDTLKSPALFICLFNFWPG